VVKPRITLLLARADNLVIGKGGDIPWHIPGEQKRFKALTMGKPMVMGRKTFESLPGVLPGRRHIVLTRDAAWAAAGAEVVPSVAAAIALAGDVPEIAVIGGAEIYALFLAHADRIELTEVHLSPPGDTIVPAFGPAWREIAREDFATHSYVTLER
jgi:dihydrofolate reductase